MNVRLLHPDRDSDLRQPLPWNADALVQDLALDEIVAAMAAGDPFLAEVARKTILLGCGNDLGTVLHRQRVLRDCMDHPARAREIYALAAEASEIKQRHYLSLPARHPDWVLRDALDVLGQLHGSLRRLRQVADEAAAEFHSEGWTALLADVRRDLSDDFFRRLELHFEQLKFREGVRIEAKLGAGNQAERIRLAPPRAAAPESWWGRLLGRRSGPPGFELDPRDESGVRALEEFSHRGIARVANAVARSADHVRGFFCQLRSELAFYIGCLNLRERLEARGEPVCFPELAAAAERRLRFRGLYDAVLALQMEGRVVGNDADADRAGLILVTGANQGGKSTFLRSLGQAQLLLPAGMFVPAESFASSLYGGVFTHYPREEDPALKRGKLDEELERMSGIVAHLPPHALVLCNESFAATNEREGSEIARQILSALLDQGVKLACATHLYELAHGLYAHHRGDVLFLRAERRPDGSRPFRLVEGEPLPTSFGEDLYRRIFGAAS